MEKTQMITVNAEKVALLIQAALDAKGIMMDANTFALHCQAGEEYADKVDELIALGIPLKPRTYLRMPKHAA